tara:strand:- start:536 stop:778 length:243 start_codon:yes stop_codon:yes gene_type:complete
MKYYSLIIKVYWIEWRKFRKEVEAYITLNESQLPKDDFDMRDLINGYLFDVYGERPHFYRFKLLHKVNVIMNSETKERRL